MGPEIFGTGSKRVNPLSLKKRLVNWGLTPEQQPETYQGGEMMMMKSVFWWRKPEYPEETIDLRHVQVFTHTASAQFGD